MKMAKKLLALVLTGVMAMSMLTGCASISSRQVADELEGMLKAANPKATVKAVDDDLAKKAVDAAKTTDGKLKAEATLKADVKTALSKDNTDKYVWYDYFETKDLKKGDKAQKIAKKIDARDAHCYNDQHQRRCQLQRGQGRWQERRCHRGWQRV